MTDGMKLWQSTTLEDVPEFAESVAVRLIPAPPCDLEDLEMRVDLEPADERAYKTAEIMDGRGAEVKFHRRLPDGTRVAVWIPEGVETGQPPLEETDDD